MQFIKKIVVWLLTWESRLILSKYKPFIVAVTGSVGKTSTKDAIYTVLKDQSKFVRKSQKSMNSEIGLPLTIIGAPNAWHNIGGWVKNVGKGFGLILRKHSYPDCLILEIGADHPGDIKKVTKWLHPNISVITKISHTPVHVEFFKSPEEVFEEKAALATAVKMGGTLVLFADDEKVMTLADRVKDKNVMVITYGLSESAKVKGENAKVIYDGEVASNDKVVNVGDGEIKMANGNIGAISEVETVGGVVASITESKNAQGKGSASTMVRISDEELVKSANHPTGLSFTLNLDNHSQSVTIDHVIGNVYMYPLLAAAAVGKAYSMLPETIAKLLNDYEAPKGRMNLVPGINDSTIIDDTYNSSPDATLSALQTLKELQTTGAKIAVLGDMMELGKFAVEEHRKIGKEAVGIVTELITVGQRSRLTADEALKNGFSKEMVHSFDNSLEAAHFLSSRVKTGDLVLVKGSQFIRMERVVKALLKEPQKASELLVRQEKEWLDKA